MNDWVAWEGGKMPIPEGTIIDVMYRWSGNSRPRVQKNCSAGDAKTKYWSHTGAICDIIKYRVTEREGEETNLIIEELKAESAKKTKDFDLLTSELNIVKTRLESLEMELDAADAALQRYRFVTGMDRVI